MIRQAIRTLSTRAWSISILGMLLLGACIPDSVEAQGAFQAESGHVVAIQGPVEPILATPIGTEVATVDMQPKQQITIESNSGAKYTILVTAQNEFAALFEKLREGDTVDFVELSWRSRSQILNVRARKEGNRYSDRATAWMHNLAVSAGSQQLLDLHPDPILSLDQSVISDLELIEKRFRIIEANPNGPQWLAEIDGLYSRLIDLAQREPAVLDALDPMFQKLISGSKRDSGVPTVFRTNSKLGIQSATQPSPHPRLQLLRAMDPERAERLGNLRYNRGIARRVRNLNRPEEREHRSSRWLKAMGEIARNRCVTK